MCETTDSLCDALDADADGDHSSVVVVRTPGNRKKTNVNNSVPAQGSELPRPIGMKKAKKLEKVQSSSKVSSDSSARTSGVANEFLSDMSAVTKDLVAAFKANTSMKREDLMTRKHDKWMKMADMYMACGQREKALAILAKIQDEESFLPALRLTTRLKYHQQLMLDVLLVHQQETRTIVPRTTRIM